MEIGFGFFGLLSQLLENGFQPFFPFFGYCAMLMNNLAHRLADHVYGPTALYRKSAASAPFAGWLRNEPARRNLHSITCFPATAHKRTRARSSIWRSSDGLLPGAPAFQQTSRFHPSDLTSYLPCLSVLATLTHVLMKRRIWPFYYAFHISVFHVIVMDV